MEQAGWEIGEQRNTTAVAPYLVSGDRIEEKVDRILAALEGKDDKTET